MAGNARKNTARNNVKPGGGNAPWFDLNVTRQRARNKDAKKSRRINRHR